MRGILILFETRDAFSLQVLLYETINSLKEIVYDTIEMLKKDNYDLTKLRAIRDYEHFTKTRMSKPILYNNINNKEYIYKNYRLTHPPFTFMAETPITIRVPEELFSHLSHIKMNEFFNVPLNKGISCLLPTHKDRHASARFEIDSTGRYIYHCYACDVRYDIIDLICELTNVSIFDAKMFLCYLFNINYETEWQKYQRDNIDFIQNYIHHGPFEKNYPVLSKTFFRKNLYGVYTFLLDIAKSYIYDKDLIDIDKPIFYMATNLMIEKSKLYGLNFSNYRLHMSVKFLARLGLIEIISDDKLSNRIKGILRDIKNKHKIFNIPRRRIDCYAIPKFTPELLHNAEKRILEDKENCVRVTHYCRTAAILDNKDLANEMYVQDINKSINPEVENFYKTYKARAIKMLDKKGYFLERDLLSYMKQYGKLQKEKYSHYCLPKLVKELQIEKVSFSKKIKVNYNISDKSVYKYNMHYGVTKLYIKKEGSIDYE